MITIGSSKFREKLNAKVDEEADKARLLVVGDVGRIEEYRRAYEQAITYRAVGYTGTPGDCIMADADSKRRTPQEAADSIIEMGDNWYMALDAIRRARLTAKEDIERAAAAPAAQQVYTAFEDTLRLILSTIIQ
jgi:hypothetical protein